MKRRSFQVLMAIIFVISSRVQAQESSSTSSSTRHQVATIIYSGLAGAVLGLSTLSFYEEPQKNLNNISMGFALGLIVGTAYVTYKATQNYVVTPPTQLEKRYFAYSTFPEKSLTKATAPVWVQSWSF